MLKAGGVGRGGVENMVKKGNEETGGRMIC